MEFNPELINSVIDYARSLRAEKERLQRVTELLVNLYREIITEMTDFTETAQSYPLEDLNSTPWSPHIFDRQRAIDMALAIGSEKLVLGDDGGQNEFGPQAYNHAQILGGHTAQIVGNGHSPLSSSHQTVRFFSQISSQEVNFRRFEQEFEGKRCQLLSALGERPNCIECPIRTKNCTLKSLKDLFQSHSYKQIFAFIDMPLIPAWVIKHVHLASLKERFTNQIQRLYDLAIKHQICLIGITHGSRMRDWTLAMVRFLFPDHQWEQTSYEDRIDVLQTIIGSWRRRNPQEAARFSEEATLFLSEFTSEVYEGLGSGLKIEDRHILPHFYVHGNGDRTPAFVCVRNREVQETFGEGRYGVNPFGFFYLGWSESYSAFLWPDITRVSFLIPQNNSYSIEDIHKIVVCQMALGDGHPRILQRSHLNAAPSSKLKWILRNLFMQQAGLQHTLKDRFKFRMRGN